MNQYIQQDPCFMDAPAAAKQVFPAMIIHAACRAFAAGIVKNAAQYVYGFTDALDGTERRPPKDPTGKMPFDPETGLDYFLGYHAGLAAAVRRTREI